MADAQYREQFASTVNRLLNKSIICRDALGGEATYDFIRSNFLELREYLEKIGIVLEIYDVAHTARIRLSEGDGYRIRHASITKLDMLVFIILYERYEEEQDYTTFTAFITRQEIINRMLAYNIDSKRLTPRVFRNILLKLKRHDLISWPNSKNMDSPEFEIEILPSITCAPFATRILELKKELEEGAEQQEDSDTEQEPEDNEQETNEYAG